MSEPLGVRKARAMALKLSLMPADLWEGQLFAGAMSLESPRVHYEHGFPDYTTEEERARAAEKGLDLAYLMHDSAPTHIMGDSAR